MRLSFIYDTRNIEFNLEYRNRKTIEIRMNPPNIINVVAPINTSKDMVLKLVKNKAPWIVRNLLEFKNIEYKKINREFINGEFFMYLGRNYSLQIINDLNIKKPEVKLYKGRFYITSNTREKSILKQAMENWYRKKALEKIKEKVKYYQKHFKETPSKIKVKEQKKRWASCTYKNELLFNWRCIMAPSNVIDYIVVHEMCHMIHKNHSKDFWNLVESIIPDYKIKKNWLKNNGIKMDL